MALSISTVAIVCIAAELRLLLTGCSCMAGSIGIGGCRDKSLSPPRHRWRGWPLMHEELLGSQAVRRYCATIDVNIEDVVRLT